MDYNQLIGAKSVTGSIRAWINWDMAPAEDILLAAQQMIYAKLRVREMNRFKEDGTIALNDSSITLPSDYIALKMWRRMAPNAGRIWHLDEEYFMQKRQRDDTGAMIAGTPMYCMIIGGSGPADPLKAYFDVKADQAYTWEMTYYGRPQDLGPANPTNFLTDRYSWALQCCCIYQAYLFQKDTALAAPFKDQFDEWINQARIDSDMEKQSREFQPWAIGDNDG